MDGWIKRLEDEYTDLYTKHQKLGEMLIKYANNTLNFTPNCAYDLLHEQYIYMGLYLEILYKRVKIEVVANGQ